MNSLFRIFILSLFAGTLFTLLATSEASAQTIGSPVVIDSFPQTVTNFNSSGGSSSSGMSGTCSTLPCCSVMVYKVTLPADGVLRVEITNFTPLAGSIIAYRPLVTTPTGFSDLEYISATPGNFCGFRDSLQLGRGIGGWHTTPYGQIPTNFTGLTAVYDFNNPSAQAGFFPAGDYYILAFNENQQSNIGIGSTTDITFEFAQSCAPLTLPDLLEFDTLEFNAQSDTLSFYVKNDRQLDVVIDVNNGVNISGVDTTQFSILTYPDSALAVGDSTLVQVIFTPTSGGAKSAELEISYSDTACATSSSILLSGIGAEPEIRLYGNGVSISQNDLTPATTNNTNMGEMVVNSGSIQKIFFIVNEGTDTLELSGSPLVDLTGSSQFSVSTLPSASILPGDSTSFVITFTPTVTGLDTLDVSIINNDADQTPFTYRMYATGAGLNGLDFDGSNDYVNIDVVAADMVGITAFTVESWVKIDPAQSGNDIILGVNTSSDGARMFVKMDDGVMEFDIGSSSQALTGPDLRDDVWHHLAFTFDNGVLNYYIDGALTAVETVNVPAFASSDQWSLGQEWDGSGASDFFNGALNEFRLWKSVRSASEVSDARYCEIGQPDTNLVAYYTFNHGVPSGSNASITSLTDWSGNGLDGTLSGFALSGSTSNFILATEVGANCTSFSVAVCNAASYTAPSGNVYTSSGVYIDTVATANGDSILFIDLSIENSVFTQDLLTDSTVCDTIRAVAQTNFTPFATFEDGDDDWIEINGVVDSLVSTNRSVFLWMREQDQVSSSQDVLVGINTSGTGTVTNFGIATNEQLWINDGGTNRNSGVVVTDGLWHFVGYTYDEASNFTQFWVDGVAAASFSNGQSISATSRISIGQEFDGTTASNFYDGDMTQLSIWNEVLDSTDIAEIMQAAIQSTHPKYANLKAYYPMTEDCGSNGFVLTDFGPHGYDGTASASDIVITDSLVNLSGFNAAPLYTKEWTALGAPVSIADTLLLTGTLQAGAYSLSLKRDFFEINDAWNVALQPSCSGPIVSLTVDSNASCNGMFDGGATASTTGGTSPYTYTWSNSATTASITGVGAGTYSVTVTDQNGNTDSTSITITEPAALFAAAVVDSNASCNGYSDGGATASATGGTMSYTYAWNNGATTASVTGVMAGTYSVTITDQNGCTDSTFVTITEPASLVAATVLDSNDAGNGGGATASATGGTMAYTYVWSNAATTASITGVGAGTYSVTITDQNGCTDSASVSIQSGPSVALAVDSNIGCNGLFDGGATASSSGGTMPYTYTWSNSATTASITGVGAGTYSVTVTDQNGLTDSSSITITEPAALVAASVVDSNVSCNGFSDGGATASATGGTMSYTYAWSNGATTASITGVSAGTYSVTITDANGCTDSSSTALTEPAALIASSVEDSSASCLSCFDGGATASASGGTMAYTYTWSNGATTASITGVGAGTYSITITDANGCTDSSSIEITSGPNPSIAVDSNVSCNGLSNGGATASATGGTMPYTYAWSNGATTASITGVSAATYTVTITDQAGLTGTNSVSITQPAVLIAATAADSNVSCNGFSDGGATASATGGTMAYTYGWSNGATTASITGVVAGTYSVTITDANGCTDSTSVTITEPATLVAATVVDSNASCNGFSDGGATASATGGTMAYTYAWSNGATTASITGAVAGTYSVTITDANGCTDSTSVTLTEPAALVAASAADSNTSCNGFSDGGASASAAGGSMPYTYTWSNAATTASITGVAAGTYSVTITDQSGCTDSASVVIMQPAVLVAAAVVDSNESCAGQLNGGVSASAMGGTSGYSFMWSNGVSTASNSGIGAGTYTVTVTDANGCTATDSATVITDDVTPPTVVTRNAMVYLDANGQASITASQIDSASFDACGINTVALDSTNFDCSEVGVNTVTLTVMDVNGNANSATATVTVLDTLAPVVHTQNVTVYLNANGLATTTASAIDSSSSDNCGIASMMLDSTSFDCSETGANPVTLTVTDVNGNISTAQAIVTVLDTLAPTVVTQNITVYLDINGEASITAAAIDSSSSDNCSIASMTLDSTNFVCGEIGVNTVVLTVTDASGNVGTATAFVNVLDTLEPTVVTQNITVYLDANGEVSITPAAVDNGSTDNCGVDFLGLDSMNFDCSEIGANTVQLTVTDFFGNADSAPAVVTVLDTLAPTVITQNVTVYLDANGGASTTIAAINNGSFDNCGIATISLDSTDFDCSEVGANTVIMTITDVNGNTDTASAIVTVLDTLAPTVITQNVTVYLDANGTASTTAAAIDNGSFDNCGISSVTLDSTSFDCSETGTNMVTLTVTDNNGNIATGTAVVTVLDTIAPVLIVGIDTALCATGTAGTVVSFSNFASDNCDTVGIVQVAGLPSGSTFPVGTTTNVFEVSDPSGNITTDSFTVEVYDFPVLSIDSVDILCETAGPVSLTGLPAGGVFSGNGVTGSLFDPTAVSPGNEELTYTYTTAEGCVYSTSIFANVRENPEVNLGVFPDTICIELEVVACPVATPAGGVYSGLGVDSILFYTQMAGIGEHWISYTYEDSYGCSDVDSTLARVVRCIDPLGVADQAASVEPSKVYPNPNRGTFTVKHGYSDQIELRIYSSDGALVRYIPQLQGQHEVSLDQWTQGVFYLQLTGARVSETLRMVVQ